MQGERVQKLLARAGIASRRAAEALILEGRVTVNGRTAVLGDRAGPGDDIRIDGRPLRSGGPHRTFALYKPPGVLTTARDDFGRRTVMDLLPDVPGLHPVGRLDLDSEGLLVLTTDGELTLRLTHPRFGHEKEYRVWCAEGRIGPEAAARLEAGVALEDGPARAAKAEPLPGGCRLVLLEGRKRQVRRMLAVLGHTVTRLLRVRIAGLELGDLRPGEHRLLSGADLLALGYTPEGTASGAGGSGPGRGDGAGARSGQGRGKGNAKDDG